MPKKAEYIKFYNFEEKNKVSTYYLCRFWKYCDRKIIERKIQKSRINKYEKHIPCIYCHKNAKMEICFRLKDVWFWNSMKFSVHMNMFWQHYLENKKLIFLACIPELPNLLFPDS